MVDLRDIFYPPITFERFAALRAKSPKRICLGSTHRNALKRSSGGKAIGYLNVPFVETFGTLFPWELWENKRGQHGGYFRSIHSENEFAEIAEWLQSRSDLVFIRSLFNTALSAGEHYAGDARSAIGELERAAKYDSNIIARGKLVSILNGVYERCLARQGVTGIISVPSSKPAALSLPNVLAQGLAQRLGLPDFTGSLTWAGPKGEIKTLNVEQKWQALANVGMNVSAAVAGQSLLLIDDMYQSGATAHYVGSQLRGAGANDIHLLCVSKGRRDTDNQ